MKLNKMKTNLFFFILISSQFNGCEGSKSSEEQYIDPHIIFSSKRWWNYDIFITDIYGGKITQLTKNRWIDFNPSISPDGEKIAFISDRDGNREIYLFHLEWLDGYSQWVGKDLQNLTNSTENDWTPVFSPLEEKIAFSAFSTIDSNSSKRSNCSKNLPSIS